MGRKCAEIGVVAGNDTELSPAKRGIAGNSTLCDAGPLSDPLLGDPTRVARRRMGRASPRASAGMSPHGAVLRAGSPFPLTPRESPAFSQRAGRRAAEPGGREAHHIRLS